MLQQFHYYAVEGVVKSTWVITVM